MLYPLDLNILPFFNTFAPITAHHAKNKMNLKSYTPYNIITSIARNQYRKLSEDVKTMKLLLSGVRFYNASIDEI